MAALQPPFNCFKMNFNALRLSIERCQYPPLPSDSYSDDVGQNTNTHVSFTEEFYITFVDSYVI